MSSQNAASMGSMNLQVRYTAYTGVTWPL